MHKVRKVRKLLPDGSNSIQLKALFAFKEPLNNPSLPDLCGESTQSRQKSDGITALFQTFLTKNEGVIRTKTAAMDY